MERLQKVIANYGITSRRKAEELIKSGHVLVNGKKVTELGTKVSSKDEIIVNNVVLKKEIQKEYYLLNKPRGYISSVSDEKNRKTIVSLIPTDTRIYPVGRLDYDTTGLILLTNDGELTNFLTHPKNKIEKTYIAKIEGILDKENIQLLKNGIDIEGKKCKPVRFKIRKKDKEKNTSIVEITIIEGRNHIVKKMFHALKHDVIKLKRESFAFLTLEHLKSGEYRELSIKEVKKLYSLK